MSRGYWTFATKFRMLFSVRRISQIATDNVAQVSATEEPLNWLVSSMLSKSCKKKFGTHCIIQNVHFWKTSHSSNCAFFFAMFRLSYKYISLFFLGFFPLCNFKRSINRKKYKNNIKRIFILSKFGLFEILFCIIPKNLDEIL